LRSPRRAIPTFETTYLIYDSSAWQARGRFSAVRDQAGASLKMLLARTFATFGCRRKPQRKGLTAAGLLLRRYRNTPPLP